MELKKTKRILFEVDYNDFQDFVTDIYGGDLEIVANEELNNGSTLEFSIPQDYYYPDKKKEDKVRSGNYPMWSFNNIVHCLIKDGHLTEEGDYLVKVDW